MSDKGLVLVTGGAKRIGAAIARRLAAEGWAIGVHYRNSRDEAEELARELGAGSIALHADLEIEGSLAAMADALAAAARPWVGLVNNASAFTYDSIASFSFAEAQAAMSANLFAPVYLARRLWERAEDGAFVVNIADQKIWNPNPDFLSYTLSKIALGHANDTLAQALAPNVRVNCVAPGLTLLSGDQTEENFTRVHGRTALRRGTTPNDVAGAVAYLAAANGVTGATLLVDAGQHLVPNSRDAMFD
ncbi:MAG: SDR family oxidoreductase [Hyphomonadaceae bacterium]